MQQFIHEPEGSAMLTEKQRGVLRGMVAGLLITLIAVTLAVLAPPLSLLPHQELTAALVQALKWDVLVVACLAANIAMLARHRFFTPADIDGGGLSPGTSDAQLLQSILQNTLEQAVLALSVHLIWAAAMPRTWQAAVPVAATLFVFGRLLFWKGYARGAPQRALGFALTFYPSVFMLLLVLARLAWGAIT
jgi:uncharacterized membrane protein YecN with MAPEG domain